MTHTTRLSAKRLRFTIPQLRSECARASKPSLKIARSQRFLAGAERKYAGAIGYEVSERGQSCLRGGEEGSGGGKGCKLSEGYNE